MKYDKLVRDKIPSIIKNNGELPISYIATENEYFKRLKNKLEEEVAEFLKDETCEELIDIIEVIYAICDYKQITFKDLDLLRKKKEELKGAFKNRIILKEVKSY